MMFLMHDSERYGYLVMNGSPIPPGSIARRCGCTLEQYETLLSELAHAGVPSKTQEGIIFCRKMVNDSKERVKSALRKKKEREVKKSDENQMRKDIVNDVTAMSRASPVPCHGDVTAMSQRSSSSPSTSSSFLNKKESVSNTEPVKINGELRGNPHTHSSLLDYFQKKHIEKLKRQTNIFDARLDPKAQALMRTHGRELAFQLVDRFFDEDRSQGDKWLEKADYSFNVFSSQAERLVNDSLNNSLDPEERIKRIEALVAERERNERVGIN